MQTSAVKSEPLRISNRALCSLLLTCGGFVFPMFGIGGLVFGFSALKEIKAAQGRLKGRTLAILSLVIGFSGVALGVFSGVVKYRKAADRAACIQNQKDLQQALRVYVAEHRMSEGESIQWSEVLKVRGAKVPECPTGGTYRFAGVVPAIGTQAVKCSHATDEQHMPKDVSGW